MRGGFSHSNVEQAKVRNKTRDSYRIISRQGDVIH